MNQPTLPSTIESITIFETGSGGEKTPVTFYQSKTRKRGSRTLQPLERLVRRVIESQRVMMNEYLAQHNRSNAKQKDGWLRDMGNNVFKAMSKSSKKLYPRDLEG
jgi:hypothetical protein